MSMRSGTFKEINWHGLTGRQFFECQSDSEEKLTKEEIFNKMLLVVSYGTDKTLEEAETLQGEMEWADFIALTNLIVGKSQLATEESKN